jgi:hypothetical protein
MIDSNTAKALGFDVTWSRVGQFSGVGGSTLTYAGVIKGPVEIRFSDQIVLHLDEVKVFDHPEPIILLGDDILGHSSRTPYTFSYLGVNPVTKEGEVIFYSSISQKFIACELVHAPVSHTSSHVIPKPTKAVHFADTKKIGNATSNSMAQRGQRL